MTSIIMLFIFKVFFSLTFLTIIIEISFQRLISEFLLGKFLKLRFELYEYYYNSETIPKSIADNLFKLYNLLIDSRLSKKLTVIEYVKTSNENKKRHPVNDRIDVISEVQNLNDEKLNKMMNKTIIYSFFLMLNNGLAIVIFISPILIIITLYILAKEIIREKFSKKSLSDSLLAPLKQMITSKYTYNNQVPSY